MKSAALLLLPLLVLCGRLLVDARDDLRQSEQHDEVEWLGRAARTWLPFGPSSTARQRLAQRGRAGDAHAYRELRASILATRWLFTPDRDLLDEANRALAHDPHELSLLSHIPEPSRPLCVLALVGLALFLFGVARALAGERSRAVVGVLGLVLLVIGLAYA